MWSRFTNRSSVGPKNMQPRCLRDAVSADALESYPNLGDLLFTKEHKGFFSHIFPALLYISTLNLTRLVENAGLTVNRNALPGCILTFLKNRLNRDENRLLQRARVTRSGSTDLLSCIGIPWHTTEEPSPLQLFDVLGQLPLRNWATPLPSTLKEEEHCSGDMGPATSQQAADPGQTEGQGSQPRPRKLQRVSVVGSTSLPFWYQCAMC